MFATYFVIGAIPEANFILLEGLWAIDTCFSLIIFISSSVGHTPCAAIVFESKTPILSSYLKGVFPVLFLISFTSFLVSET